MALDYEKLYSMLSRQISDTIEALDKASEGLKHTQVKSEEVHISSEDEL